MPENGAGSVTVSVTLDRSTGKVSMRGPKDKAAVYSLLKAGLEAVRDKIAARIGEPLRYHDWVRRD